MARRAWGADCAYCPVLLAEVAYIADSRARSLLAWMSSDRAVFVVMIFLVVRKQKTNEAGR